MNNFRFFKKYTLLSVVLSISLYGNLSARMPHNVPDTGKLLDMTYAFDEQTIYWPTAE